MFEIVFVAAIAAIVLVVAHQVVLNAATVSTLKMILLVTLVPLTVELVAIVTAVVISVANITRMYADVIGALEAGVGAVATVWEARWTAALVADIIAVAATVTLVACINTVAAITLKLLLLANKVLTVFLITSVTAVVIRVAAPLLSDTLVVAAAELGFRALAIFSRA